MTASSGSFLLNRFSIVEYAVTREPTDGTADEFVGAGSAKSTFPADSKRMSFSNCAILPISQIDRELVIIKEKS